MKPLVLATAFHLGELSRRAADLSRRAAKLRAELAQVEAEQKDVRAQIISAAEGRF